MRYHRTSLHRLSCTAGPCRLLGGLLALVLLLAAVSAFVPLIAAEKAVDVQEQATELLIAPLSTQISVQPGQLMPASGEIAENEIYSYVKGYELKKGHTLSISGGDYVFSVRQLIDGNYNTILKSATANSFTATEDMTVGMLIRKSDKSALTEDDFAAIKLYDSQYGMIDVNGYAHRFTVEAETIDGGTATTRAAIFLPDSYTGDGEATPLIIMTNGGSAYLTESSWQGNTEANRDLVKFYLQNGYAVLINDNTAGKVVNNTNEMVPDLGCLQQLSGLMKSYEYVCDVLNLERKFSIHARSQGTFVGIRIMREYPELVKCALITGPNVSAAHRWTVITNKDHTALRFGFADLTGSTFEADKFVGNDIYTDMAAEDYSLPPTFWMESNDDVCPDNNKSIYEVVERLRELGCTAEYQKFSDLTHSETCRLASEQATTAALAFLEKYQSFSGKTISILGASISTYAGTSNGAAADTSNSTIRNNVKYYPNTTISEVTLEDTWWMQVASDLDLRLLVNNAWSGSAILLERAGTPGAYVDRCVQLHDDTGENAGEEPDIICIQMGFNDFSYGKDTLGTAEIDYDALILADGYAEPTTTMEATAIMLDKITKRYPDAEVYMFNHFKRIGQSASDTALMEQLNASIQTVCDRYGVSVVDLYTALTDPAHIGDGRLHPNKLGMDTITEAVKRTILANTSYDATAHTVSLVLDGVSADYGDDKLVLDGDSFALKLSVGAHDALQVKVTMGGEDITADCYADGAISIDAVTSDVTITAKSVHMPQNYTWTFDGGDLVSTGRVQNTLTKNAGTTTDGVFDKTRYALQSAVVLMHDQPWVVEWKSEGTFQNTSGSGARLFTSDDVNAHYNARYIFKSNTNGIIAMGEKDTAGSHNYGVALADYGIDWTALHTYRLENRIATDGSNMVYLYVDGQEIGALSNYYIGTKDQETTSDWLSGKDFVFPYMGTDTHGFTNCSIEYIKVWEAGNSFEGKTVSILSHSASTYAGVSNNTEYNSTIGNNDVYYTEGRHGVYREDTWWQQAADALGMEVLVNNSWSGSCIYQPRKGEASVCYGDRAVNLHNDHTGEEPDVIWVYIGGNDFAYYKDTFGKAADVDYTALIQDNGDGTYTYAAPTTTCEAYAITLHKIENRYPDAEIYCMTSTARREVDYTGDSYPDAGQPTEYSAELHKIAADFGYPVADLEKAIPKEIELFDKYMGDKRAHPNALGMDRITEEILSVMLGREVSLWNVSGTYQGVMSDNSAATVIAGDIYSATLTLESGYTDMQVTVTMGGEDITAMAYTNGKIYIEAVTGEIVICATAQRDPLNFRWEMKDNALQSTGRTANALTVLEGSVTDGMISTGRYQLEIPVVLRHDFAWVIEWKCAGDWRGALFNAAQITATKGEYYLSRTKGGQLCFGAYDGTQYNNYGVNLSDLDAGVHVFRLENRITGDGNNMIWLSVDGGEALAMHNYFVGSNSQNSTSDWVSGKDFTFAYMGTTSAPLNNCSVEYIKVWEAAEPLALRYDDRYDVTGKVVEIIDAGTPTSYKVGYGVEAGTLDDAVVTLDGEKLIATGIGTALVRIDGVLYEITVTPAPISLILLAGQSNMRGSEGNANQSIVCPEGMVYATYGDDRGADNTAMTLENATMFAPSALAGEYSSINVNGTTDCLSGYPIYSLTDAGNGKIGPDSGFAYEWVKQTGEKVWIVNAAHGGTSISVWQPGTTEYEQCQALFTACQQTLQAEIAAGHYTLSHMGYFWCQGCSDRTKTAEWYVDKYLTMHEGFKSELAFDHDSNPETADKTFEFGGIIPVRVGSTTTCYRDGVYEISNSYAYHESFVDLRMSGPRVAQFWLGNNPELTDIHLVCTIGEDWVWMPDGTNGVADYFNAHYENGTVDYTTQVAQSASWYIPTTPAAVHDSIHYSQIGYNEIGRESVRNLMYILGLKQAPEAETTVKLVGWDGYTEVDSITAATSGASGTLVVPIVTPLWNAKSVTYSVGDGLTYHYYDVLAESAEITGTLTVVGAQGSVTVEKGEPGMHFADHLATLPENLCCNTNLWSVLEHDPQYYASGTHWAVYSSGATVPSITIPVNPGDKIFATSFGKAGENGHASSSGIRVTFFSDYGIAKTTNPAGTYSEFVANGGYLIAPEGAVAINIAMWNDSDDNEVYILSAEHTYTPTVTAPTCEGQGYTTHTCTACGDEYEDNFTEAVGHTFGEIEMIDSDTRQSACTNCGTTKVYERMELPLYYSGEIHVENNSEGLFAGSRNIADLLGLKSGTYTDGDVTIVINGAEITVTGTPSKTLYFDLQKGTFGTPDYKRDPGYSIPDGDYRFGLVGTGSSFPTACIRYPDGKGNVVGSKSVGSYNDLSGADFGIPYLYLPAGQTYDFTGHLLLSMSVDSSFDSDKAQTMLISENGIHQVDQYLWSLDSDIAVFGTIGSHDSGKIQYSNGNKQYINVYLPREVGYLQIQMNLVDSANSNAYGWRLNMMYACDNYLNQIFPITNVGEYEAAIQLTGRPDFMGMGAHGSECMTSFEIYVDGTQTTLESLLSMTDWKSITIKRESDFYDPLDETTLVATHTVIYNFDLSGLTVTQDVNWLVDTTCKTSYMMMFPVRRAYNDLQVTDTYYDDFEATHYDVSETGFTSYPVNWTTGATKMTLFSEKSGITATMESLESMDMTGSNYKHVANTAAYNKMYFTICGAKGTEHAVTAGDLWHTKHRYEVFITEGTDCFFGHEYTTVTIPATCTEQGYTTHTCDACGDSYVDSYVDATGHDYTTLKIPATCTEGGYAVHTCTACGDEYEDDFKPATGHSWSGVSCSACDAMHPEAADYKDKVISILSASTSTFAGYIPEADGFNLAHRPRYPQDNLLTDVNETWWMQVIAELGAKLGINDSWAGSQVLNTLDKNSGDLGPDAAMASITRIKNLGANGTPDVILFFGAGNDMGRGVPVGSFDPATAPTEVDLTATKWETFADAYVAAIMRMQYYYPDARIVAMTTYAMPSYVTQAKLDKYGPVIKAICEHYGVEYLSLQDCGVTFDMLPDNIHPNAEGMDHITAAVVDKLLSDVDLTAGENKVYTVTHKLGQATAALSYYKGISAGSAFTELLDGKDLQVSVSMGGVDITSTCYANGRIDIPSVTGDLVITVKGKFTADGHLQELPDSLCPGTNLWQVLTPESIYYTASGWGNTAAGTTWSITFPVQEGDKIWATSLGAYPDNGSSANGVRVTWFDENGVLQSLSRDVVYAEFAEYGYITAPEGAVALNLPMTNNQDHYAVYILSAEHTYTSVITAPTCESEGYTTYTCHCGDEYVADKVAALGHDMGEWQVTTKPTCETEGEQRRDCTRCDHFETEPIKATGHDHKATVTAPTCTAEGYTTYTCHCGDEYVADKVAALGHNMGEWKVTTQPTCETEGEQRRDCDRCDHFETEVIEATGHAHESVVTAPTCLDQGYTTYTCHCGDEYVADKVAALGHDMGEWVVTTEPACETEGEQRRDCDRCDHFETEAIKATGHDYESVITPPTCESDGYTTYTCHCGDEYVADKVAALGHNMGEWVVTTEPTCETEGEQRRDCDRCDHFETEVIKATGHDYESVIIPSTCTAEGYTTYTCHCGDSYVDDEVPALGHTEGDWIVDEQPQIGIPGSKHTACTACGQTLRVEAIDALPEPETETKTESGTETETETGTEAEIESDSESDSVTVPDFESMTSPEQEPGQNPDWGPILIAILAGIMALCVLAYVITSFTKQGV